MIDIPGLSIGLAYGVAAMGIVSVLIEIVEIIAKLTPSEKDDLAVAKAKKVKDMVISVLEIFPHVNLPIAPIVLKIGSVLGKILKGLKAAKEE
jgi:hypothetical protein